MPLTLEEAYGVIRRMKEERAALAVVEECLEQTLLAREEIKQLTKTRATMQKEMASLGEELSIAKASQAVALAKTKEDFEAQIVNQQGIYDKSLLQKQNELKQMQDYYEGEKAKTRKDLDSLKEKKKEYDQLVEAIKTEKTNLDGLRSEIRSLIDKANEAVTA